MKYAVIDIGSNTVRLNIYDQDQAGRLDPLLSKKHVAGLASYVDNGLLSQKGIDKLIRILGSFQRICQTFAIDKVIAFATASLRYVANRDEVIASVQPLTGLTIELISGEAEAWYGYQGILHDYDIHEGIIVDIGGGSCELTLIQDRDVVYAQSLAAGSLSLYKKFCSRLLPAPEEVEQISSYVQGLLEQSGLPQPDHRLPIYGVGGTLRATGNLCQEYLGLESSRQIGQDDIKVLSKALLAEESEAMRTLLQVSPERVHTICPGILMLLAILTYSGAQELLISDKGVREGILLSKLAAGY